MNLRVNITVAITGLFLSLGFAPGFAQASDCKWQATIGPPPQLSDFLILTVTGVCQQPTPGYMLTLNRVTLAQADASTMTLMLDAVAPTGTVPQITTPTTVEFRQVVARPMPAPTKVIVLETAATLTISRAN
jgi:hypothetical protein